MNRTERKDRHRSIRGEANLATHSSLAAALTESLKKKKTTQQHRVSSSGVKQAERAGLEVEAPRRTALKEDYRSDQAGRKETKTTTAWSGAASD